MTDAVLVGALEWEADYSAMAGSLPGSADQVECVTLAPGVFTFLNDQDAKKTLLTGLISLEGFQGPLDLTECTVHASEEPTPADVAITVIVANDVNLVDIQPLPEVVASIHCSADASADETARKPR
jgi:hypothetical protein